MKNQENEKKEFNLMQVDNTQLVHVSEWEKKLKELVKANPYVKITDKKSLALAKERKANLREARLELRTSGKSESQESMLLNKLKNITAFVKDTIDKLVDIPKTPEDKQDIEIKRFEQVLADLKAEEDEKEEKRTKAIRDEIDRVKLELATVTENATFKTLGSVQEAFDKVKVTDVELMELSFLFDEMIIEQQKILDDKIEAVKQAENDRLEKLSKDREAIINQMIVDGQEVVDGIEANPVEERLIKQIISGIFQTLTGYEIEFDADSLKKIDEEKEKAIGKVKDKFEKIHNDQVQETKNRLVEVREGLLDLIFQTNVSNHEDNEAVIKKALNQEVMEDVLEDFEKMKVMVANSWKRKMSELSADIEKEEKRLSDQLNDRIKTIQELGMTTDDDQEWNGFDCKVFVDDLFNYDGHEFDGLVEEIKQAKSDDEAEQERQTLIRPDKITMVDAFVQVKNKISEIEPDDFVTEGMFVHFVELKKQLMELCDSNIETINKL
jgi:hypothetical protein